MISFLDLLKGQHVDIVSVKQRKCYVQGLGGRFD